MSKSQVIESSNEQEFGFDITAVNAFRDFVQGLFGNRIPLNDPQVLELYSLWNELILSNEPASTLKFGAIEAGGADPQVTAVFRNKSPITVFLDISEAAPDATIRPLYRGENAFLLAGIAKEDRKHILRTSAKSTNSLKVKVFDSQGDLTKVEETVAMIAELREEGSDIQIEVAIPYSNGQDCDPNRPGFNPYPDELYVEKVQQAAALAKKYNIPSGSFSVSLKDMVGQLKEQESEQLFGEINEQTAKQLIGKIIDRLKEKNLKIPLALHLHDTGLATDAYAAAINVAKEKNWPLIIDTVEAHDLGEGYQKTGFTSLARLQKVLRDNYNIDLGITEEQQAVITRMAQLTDEIAVRFEYRRVNLSLTGEQLREFDIPGGGFASFVTAVKEADLAGKLGISDDEAVLLAANGLKAVSPIMGYPFAVTPGFQNKQISALNLLGNMIDANYLTKDMKFDELRKKLLTPLNDTQVETLFLKNLKVVVRQFLTGNMPQPVHPVVAATLSKETFPPAPSLLPAATKIVTELQNEGRIKPTIVETTRLVGKLQKEGIISNKQGTADKILALLEQHNVIYEAPNGKASPWHDNVRVAVEALEREGVFNPGTENAKEILAANLNQTALESNIVWAMIAGPDNFRANIEKSDWFREPDPSDKENYPTKEDYNKALKKFQKGLNPVPDAVDRIWTHYENGALDIEAKDAEIARLYQKEKTEIQRSVYDYIGNNAVLVASAVVNIAERNEEALTTVFDNLYHAQQQMLTEKARKGEQFLYSDKDRQNIAADVMALEIAALVRDPAINGRIHAVKAAVREEIESVTVKAPMPGVIKQFKVKKGDIVREGDVLCVMEAMKMEMPVRATKGGVIKSITSDKSVNQGDGLVNYESVAKSAAGEKKVAGGTMQAPAIPITTPVLGLGASIKRAAQRKLEQFQEESVEVSGKTPASAGALEKQAYLPLEQQGYFGEPFSLTPAVQALKDNNQIHVIGNRGGCAAKIYAGLKQAGRNTRLLYTQGDVTTPIIRYAPANDKIRIGNYTDQDEMIQLLSTIAKENPGKEILFHPGWGFLSEKPEFVDKLEKLKSDKGINVVFVGPPSQAMSIVGGKLTFRDEVQSVAPEFNVGYLGNNNLGDDGKPLAMGYAAKLKEYADGDFSKNSSLDAILRDEFRKVTALGGDVMIKAVDGGGGRGITPFKIDAAKSEEENYRAYVKALLQTAQDSERLFGNSKTLTEQCIRGNTRHFEIQIAATDGEAIVLGNRDCTEQRKGQKYSEKNIKDGDYPPEVIERINTAAQKLASQLAKELGYTGLGTLEALARQNTKGVWEIFFLEMNPRLQVEHPVTEQDISQKTGLNPSLALYNAHLVSNPEKRSPQQLLRDLFDIAPEQIPGLGKPSDKRIFHFRVVSQEVDLATGTTVPHFVRDDMWSAQICKEIHEKTGATIIQGGLGDGTRDPQIGSIYGAEKQVLEAARLLELHFRSVQARDRIDAKTNLDSTLKLYPTFMNPDGTVNTSFGTGTTDELQKLIQANAVASLTNREALPEYRGHRPLKADALKEAVVQVTEASKLKGEPHIVSPLLTGGRRNALGNSLGGTTRSFSSLVTPSSMVNTVDIKQLMSGGLTASFKYGAGTNFSSPVKPQTYGDLVGKQQRKPVIPPVLANNNKAEQTGFTAAVRLARKIIVTLGK